MRKLALAPALLLLVWSAPALANDSAPAITARTASFELFGTSFCYGTSQGCDVTFAPEPAAEPVATTVVAGDGVKVTRIFGLTLCSAPRALGPTCDISWSPPQPAKAWRDYPEVRLLAELDRFR